MDNATVGPEVYWKASGAMRNASHIWSHLTYEMGRHSRPATAEERHGVVVDHAERLLESLQEALDAIVDVPDSNDARKAHRALYLLHGTTRGGLAFARAFLRMGGVRRHQDVEHEKVETSEILMETLSDRDEDWRAIGESA